MANLPISNLQCGFELFNDNDLPEELRSSCLALVAQQEVRSNLSLASANPSPKKKNFLAQVAYIQGLHAASKPEKDRIMGQLTQTYYESKNNLESTPLVPTIPKEAIIGIAPSQPPTTLAVTGTMSFVATKPFKPIPRISSVWLNSLPVQHERFADAMTDVGPSISQVKKYHENGFFVTELQCKIADCPRRMRIRSPGEDSFSGPVYLTKVSTCHHKLLTWAEHYRSVAAKKRNSQLKVVSPRIGLHPLVRAYTDALAMTKLEPKQICRKIQIDFESHPMFLQSRQVRDIITDQIKERIRLVRKQIVQKDPMKKNISIEYTHDVVAFKNKHRLRLPTGFSPQVIESETHLLELARSLEKLGHLYGKKHEPTSDFPHRDLIVLEYADVEESSRYKLLDARREKEKAASNQMTRESVKANTVVFTSLALLYNLCSSAKLDWEVCGSADGTHGLLSNDYKVIGFGVYHVAPDGVKRFHPLAYALATGELELVSLLLLHYLKRIALDLFGLTPQFKGGIISDHTEVFVNAFQEAFPNDQVMQCFPHIIRKFRIDGRREGNGQYMKLLENHQASWLWNIAEEDVNMLRGCRSQPMFDKLKDMILTSWRLDGEQRLADAFRESYLDNPLFNKWRYNVSGIPGCIPQNNSHERSNLDTKGCATFAGIIQAGRNMTVMLNEQFPRLIYVNSIERTEVERNYPILDESKTMKPLLFQFFLQFDRKVDCVPYGDGFLVNRGYTLGQPIDQERIQQYEDSMEGIFELDNKDRQLFYHRVNDFCMVKKKRLDPNKDPFFTGSCFHFYNHLSCHHAAVFQYAHTLPTLAKKISQEKQGRNKRRKTGLERRNKWEMRKMAEQQDRLNSSMQTEQRAGKTSTSGYCHPITQPDELEVVV